MKTRQKKILKSFSKKMKELANEKAKNSSIILMFDIDLMPEIKEKIEIFRMSLAKHIDCEKI